MGKQTSEGLFAMGDFRLYLKAWARTRGRGEFSRISQELKIHSTLTSQILNGKKCFTEEQAARLCAYMRLNTLEADYFLKLIQIERAGTEQLKNTFRRHLLQLRLEANEVKNRVSPAKELTEADQAIFYSSWQYSLVRLMTSIDKFQNAEKIAQYLSLPISRVQEILDFLASRNLCVETRGNYRRSEKNTHVSANSPLALRHHQNWRNKVIELQEKMKLEDLAFTAPVSLSFDDVAKVKAILLDAIGEISKLSDGSPAETVAYLGIDWIRV